MNLVDKKYFSISEVAKITGISLHKLRYLEKSTTEIKIFQIKGRRYYSTQDIKYIKSKFGLTEKGKKTQNVKNLAEIPSQIDSLILKFVKLKKELI